MDQGFQHQIEQQDQRGLLRIGLTATISVFLASLVPGPLFMATLSGLLHLVALMSILVAVLNRQSIWQDQVTFWDEAAILFGGSLLFGLFVDHAAVEQFIGAAQDSAAGAGAIATESAPAF